MTEVHGVERVPLGLGAVLETVHHAEEIAHVVHEDVERAMPLAPLTTAVLPLKSIMCLAPRKTRTQDAGLPRRVKESETAQRYSSCSFRLIWAS